MKKIIIILLMLCMEMTCFATDRFGRPEKPFESDSELLYSKNGESYHFVIRIVSPMDKDAPFFFRKDLIGIKELKKGESIFSILNFEGRGKYYGYSLYGWGSINGSPNEFAKRFENKISKDFKPIRFNKIQHSEMARLINVCAETDTDLEKIPSIKSWLKSLNEELEKYCWLIGFLMPDSRTNFRERGRDIDLYSVFTGISAIRETLQSDANLNDTEIADDPECKENIRKIGRATDMYRMDNSEPMKELDLKLLVKGKYLQSMPICNGKSDYYYSDKGQIRCPRHGDYLNSEPDESEAKFNEELVSVGEIKGPEAPSHDWKKMIKNPDLKLPASYNLIPEDCAFIHFPSYTAFRKAFDFFSDWSTSFGAAFGGESGKANFNIEKQIKDQLLLKTDILTKLFADVVLSDIVFLSEDPFIFEGSAFAIILKINNEPMLTQKLSMTADEFCKNYPEIKESKMTIDGHTVQAFTSQDFHFRSYRLIAQGHQIVCNSPVLMEKIVALINGNGPSMAKSLDLRYFYEHIENNFPGSDRIFTFLSDAFIRKLIGPAYKVATKQRLECIRNSLLQSYEALVNGKMSSELKCPEDGKYSFENCQLSCSKHRSFGYMTPVSESLPKQITRSEASAYNRFVTNYNQYFTQFFDPIGFVFSTEPTFRGRLLIMPLVEKGIYSELQQNLKIEPMNPGPKLKNGVLKVGTKLKADKFLNLFVWGRGIVDSKLYGLIDRWFTGCIWIHLADHPLLFQWESNLVARGILDELGGRGRNWGFAGMVPGILSIFSPMMFAVEMTSEKHYQDIIDLIKLMNDSTRKRRGFLFSPNVKMENLIENGIEMYVLSIDLFAIKKTFYLTQRNGFILIASKKELLYELEDPEKDEKTRLKGNFNLVFYPQNFKLMRSDLLEMRARSQRDSCLTNLRNLHFVSCFKPEEAYKYYHLLFGSLPACPAGGKYSPLAPVSCSVHGTIKSGVIKSVPDFLNGIKSISIQNFINADGFQSEIIFDQSH